MSVWPCIVDDMKRVKRTRCYTVDYWTLWIAQHVSGITMPIIRGSRLYRWSQRMAPHLGYGRLLVWCMAVGFWSVRLEGCFTTQHVSGITMPIIRSSRLYRWSQRMAPHLGYGRLLVWCMAVGFWSVRLEGCFTTLTRRSKNLQPCTRPATCHKHGEVPYAETICIVASSWWWAQ